MTKLLMATLMASLVATACGTSAADGDRALDPATDTTVTTTTTTTSGTPRATRGTSPAAAARPAAPRAAAFRDVTIPTGTVLHLRLNNAVASDTSTVEDAVTAELTSAVMVGGETILPVGAIARGNVTDADDSGRVKGLARIAFDLSSMTAGGARYPMSAAYAAEAAATKGEDAAKIGIGAGAGAVIGGLLGGKDGAAKGAAVGGGAGTGVVLATRGREIRLAAGSDVSTPLTAPLTVRISN